MTTQLPRSSSAYWESERRKTDSSIASIVMTVIFSLEADERNMMVARGLCPRGDGR